MNTLQKTKFLKRRSLSSLYNTGERFFTSSDYSECNYFLAFFRISIALIALVDIISMSTDWKLMLSYDQTFAPQQFLYVFSEYYRPLNSLYELLEETGLKQAFYNYAIITYIVALVCFLLGLFTRLTAFITLVLQLIIFKSFNELNYGYDQFLTMSFFYSLLFPVGRYFSIDSLVFKPALTKYQFDYRKVIAVHLCIVYFFSGVSKILDVSWWNGVALWRAISSVYNDYFKTLPIILTLLGIGTILLETFYPFLIFNKNTRKYALYAVIAMHIGIAIVLRLYSFAMIMIVWNLSAFYKFVNESKE